MHTTFIVLTQSKAYLKKSIFNFHHKIAQEQRATSASFVFHNSLALVSQMTNSNGHSLINLSSIVLPTK